MQIYLVGGAVRDELLGLPVSERDWVVVGATPEQLVELGYRPVGKDFPVFLHPETKEEYALARTERKTGRGYHGFSFHASPAVTLEEDLRRRDLTINAMARTAAGELVDPYGGQRDLEERLLRHVSPAFREDPVRVLRVARFAARLQPLGFKVAEETLTLMRGIGEDGEMDTLTPERVFMELRRALMEPAPEAFVSTMHECAAWPRVFPLLPDPGSVAQTLREAARAQASPEVRFACLSWHSTDIDAWCTNSRAPRSMAKAAKCLHRNFETWRTLDGKDPAALLALIESLGGIRQPQQVADFRAAAQVLDTMLETDHADTDQQIQIAHAAALDCNAGAVAQEAAPEDVAARVREARLQAVRIALEKSQ